MLGREPHQLVPTFHSPSDFLSNSGYHNLFVHTRKYKSSASVHSRSLIKPDIMKRGWSQNSPKEPSRTKVLMLSRLIRSLDPSLNASAVERFPADLRGAPCL